MSSVVKFMIIGCAAVVAFLAWNDSLTPTRKWETISGVQQGVRINIKIDANSIQREVDGSSASTEMQMYGGGIQRIEYLCRDRAPGLPGEVFWQGQRTELQPGTSSYAVMERICFGPLS